MHGAWLASYIALWLIVGLLSVMVLTLVSDRFREPDAHPGTKRIRRSDDRMPVGVQVPELLGTDLNGRTIDLVQFRGEPLLLIFLSPSHQQGASMLPDITRIAEGTARRLVIVLVPGEGDLEGMVGREAEKLKLTTIVPDSRKSMADFSIPRLPFAVSVNVTGEVEAKGVITSAQALALMV